MIQLQIPAPLAGFWNKTSRTRACYFIKSNEFQPSRVLEMKVPRYNIHVVSNDL